MLAHYGYKDGSGDYYISIDTDKCSACPTRDCVAACPAKVFEIITDDYDEKAAAVTAQHVKKLKYSCAPCKPNEGGKELPCRGACPSAAITHSW